MNNFKFKDYNRLKENKELMEELVHFEGYVPSYLMVFNDYFRYTDNLKEKKIYEKYLKELHKHREEYRFNKDRNKYLETELMEWLKDNPKFNKILNNSIKE